MFVEPHHMLDTTLTNSLPTQRGARAGVGAARSAREPQGTGGVIAIPEDAALVLVDMQRAFDRGSWGYWSAGARNNAGAEGVAARLLREWRATGRPIIHVRHRSASIASPLRSNTPGAEFNVLVQPHSAEPVYEKRHGSAFVETTLARDLRERRIRTVVLAGLTTDHAVSSTARSASDLGFTTMVVSDATATFDREGPDARHFPAELIHQTALASLHADGAIVLTSAHVLEGVALAAM